MVVSSASLLIPCTILKTLRRPTSTRSGWSGCRSRAGGRGGGGRRRCRRATTAGRRSGWTRYGGSPARLHAEAALRRLTSVGRAFRRRVAASGGRRREPVAGRAASAAAPPPAGSPSPNAASSERRQTATSQAMGVHGRRRARPRGPCAVAEARCARYARCCPAAAPARPPSPSREPSALVLLRLTPHHPVPLLPEESGPGQRVSRRERWRQRRVRPCVPGSARWRSWTARWRAR